MKKLLLIPLILLFVSTGDCQQNMPIEKGTWTIGISTSGGSGVSGNTTETSLWLTGIRFGKVLTKELGNGMLRGRLEYTVETIPVFLVFQEKTIYGFDITPVLLKWNFTGPRGMIPYFEVGAGMLITSDDVPEQTFPFNFTPQAGFGFHILTGPKQAFTIGFRYMHISNGGLESPNPGINTIQVLAGYHWFR
jgi:hypothetical protein